MTPQAVMARYRKLGSFPLAAIDVRREFQERGQQHWHRLYERCWCGFLTVPAACYTYDEKGRQTNTQAQAEKAYLASLSPQDVPTNNMTGKPDLCECGRPNEVGRSLCAACRKRAYRSHK
jgi:hypothetical protein